MTIPFKVDQDYIVAVRRELHMYPELAWDLDKTSALVRRELDKMGIEYDFEKYGRNTVVATMGKKDADFTIGIRADMDALPIHEAENGLPFRVSDGGGNGVTDQQVKYFPAHGCGIGLEGENAHGEVFFFAGDSEFFGHDQQFFLFQSGMKYRIQKKGLLQRRQILICQRMESFRGNANPQFSM